jgi:signal peptidase I
VTQDQTLRRPLAIPIGAAVLSAFLPGTGQGFAGRPLRGLGVSLALAAATIFALVSFLFVPSIFGLALPVALLLAGRLWAMVDAARVASRSDAVRWSKRLVYAALLLVAGLFVDSVGGAARHRYFGSSFRLPTGSMEPTLLEGEYFITVPVSPADVRRGEVVAFHFTDDSTRSFVKRIVGVPGDTIAMHDGLLFLNNRAVSESYAHHANPAADPGGDEFDWQRSYSVSDSAASRKYRPTLNNWGPILVPAKMYFVLGDNRDNSLDSRARGFVSASGVFARPFRIYFSRDLETGRIRWNRLGVELLAPPA